MFQVLDLGFNLMTEIPADAFQRTPGLTLLALDGNPLRTVPEQALVPLKGSLRGLSLGGRALVCDCRIRWLVRWLRSEHSLQLTSRERDPQFCGSPARLRDRAFSNIRPDGKRLVLQIYQVKTFPSPHAPTLIDMKLHAFLNLISSKSFYWSEIPR